VILKIECADGIRPLRVIGRDGRVDDDRVTIGLNQLYGGQEKYALIEVEIPAGTAEETREIATVLCEYENAVTQRRGRASAKTAARFSRSEREVVESANKDVQGEIVRNVIAEAKDQAVDLFDAGRPEAAKAEVRESREDARRVSRMYGLESDDELREDLSEFDDEVTTLENEGMDQSRRKAYRAQSYQTRHQQLNQ
jgi:Ca-activated chloride channel family protein